MSDPRRRRWSADDEALLIALVSLNTPDKIIAERLDRTPGTVSTRKTLLRIVEKKPVCGNCGGPINQSGIGRPRKYCGQQCNAFAHNKRKRDKRKEEPDDGPERIQSVDEPAEAPSQDHGRQAGF